MNSKDPSKYAGLKTCSHCHYSLMPIMYGKGFRLYACKSCAYLTLHYLVVDYIEVTTFGNDEKDNVTVSKKPQIKLFKNDAITRNILFTWLLGSNCIE